jgi:hypothetical protein
METHFRRFPCVAKTRKKGFKRRSEAPASRSQGGRIDGVVEAYRTLTLAAATVEFWRSARAAPPKVVEGFPTIRELFGRHHFTQLRVSRQLDRPAQLPVGASFDSDSEVTD